MALPILYLAVAEPLVEIYRTWLAKAPPITDKHALRTALVQFPKDGIGAYQLELPNKPDYSHIAFRTGHHVKAERVKATIVDWSGSSPQEILEGKDPVPRLDQDKLRADFKQALHGSPTRLIERVGLSLQQLQRDLATFKPEMVLLLCHGTS